jgi:hypothetical protein
VPAPGIPLADIATAMLARLAEATGSRVIADLDGETLLGERAALIGMTIPGRASAGGACRLIDARDDVVALNLARPSDRELLPALFEDDTLDAGDDDAIAARIAQCDATPLVARGRLIGLPIAAMRAPAGTGAPCVELVAGPPAPADRRDRPKVIDLAALWAGPLAAHLLGLAGGAVAKVESPARPDAMRAGQPGFHALLDAGKTHHALDPRDPEDRRALLDLIADADIVIEAARPRALAQLGIDADAIVRATPGLVWLTITAHGATGEPAGWVGFGDDVGVAAGLSAALHDASGRIGFVGDAIADPLTGIRAALAGWTLWQQGRGGRHGIAMRDVARDCLDLARGRDADALDARLVRWATSAGRPFPPIRRRC